MTTCQFFFLNFDENKLDDNKNFMTNKLGWVVYILHSAKWFIKMRKVLFQLSSYEYMIV